MKAYLHKDKDDESKHIDVERGATQKRDTRSDPSIKFAGNIASESLKEGNDGRYEWLAAKW